MNLEQFRTRVEAFITKSHISPTALGRMVGDPRFVFDLRKGREPRESTRDKVLEAMSAAQKKGRPS